MSRVANIVLLGDLEKRLDQINKILHSQETVSQQAPFVLVDAEQQMYVGSKALESDVAVGAINYLDVQRFIADLRSGLKSQDDIDRVQLVYQDQDDFGWTMVDILGSGT